MPVDDEDLGDGELVLPEPEDPANPTIRETLAVALALLTALGVAAARAVWQRTQERQARTERARGGAGKTSGSGDGAGSGGGRTTRSAGGSGSKSSSPSLLRALGDSPKKKPSGGPKGGGGGSRPPGGGSGVGKGSNGPKGRTDGKGGPGSKAPKAGPGGRRQDADKPGHKKDGADKGGVGRRLRRGVEKLKRKDGKDSAGKTTPDKTPAPTGRKLVWRAPKHRPGPGDDKAIAGRRRWSGRTRASGKDESSKRRGGWRSAFRWVKRWRAGRRTDDTPPAPSSPAAATTETPEQEAGTPTDSPTDPPPSPPPPGGGWTSWMRPPPWADRRTWVTVERVDHPAQPPRREPKAPALAGAPAAGRPALPAGRAESPTPAPHQERATFVSTPVKTTSTQYADAELTVGDVIEADADMASEITDGVSEALATADGCERLLTRLEALHAKVVELQVPGSLEGMVVELMELTTVVKARSEAIAAKLPAAAEAIATAGSNAESRHKPLADAVRDAGHIRPAEREYHDQ
ncbi:hypothetical protein [Micrococcus luteus]|uniref:hypothetical protein n=1 Tax=Micrococcus luteus TaxID=1270 RepID=UPI003324D3E1